MGQNKGVYPCCNAMAERFTTVLPREDEGGCLSQNHKLIETSSPRKSVKSKYKNFELLLDNYSEVVEPYEYRKVSANTGDAEVIRKSIAIYTDDCLSVLLAEYVQA